MCIRDSQYSPVGVEDLVLGLFAGTKGYLDALPVTDVRRFEAGLIEFVRSRYPQIPDEIGTTGKMSDETEKKLGEAIEEFARTFQTTGSTELEPAPDKVKVTAEGTLEGA